LELVAAGADVIWDAPAVVLVAVESVVEVDFTVVAALAAALDEPAVPGRHCE